MLCSKFLRVVHTKRGLAGLLDRAFDALFAGYKSSLGLVLRHRVVMVGVFVVVLAATVHMYGVVPKGFIPDQDNDSMNINIRAAQGTSFYQMSTAAQRVAEVVRQNPYIDSFMVRTGGGNSGTVIPEHGEAPVNPKARDAAAVSPADLPAAAASS
jgi:multidrug efflux pump subunit AcrB